MFNKLVVNTIASIGTAIVVVLFFIWAALVLLFYPVTWLVKKI